MKKIFYNITAIAAALLTLGACHKPAEIVTDMKFERVFTPTDLSVEVIDKLLVFEWSLSKGATDFTLEIYSKPEEESGVPVLDPSTLVKEISVPADEVPYLYDTTDQLEPGSYYFRVRGWDAKDGGLAASHWAVYTDSKTGEPKLFKIKGEDPEPEPEPTGDPGFIVFDEYVGAKPESITSGSMTITPNYADGKIAIDANTAYFGTAEKPVKFTARMKSGAKSSANNGITITIAEDAAGTLKIYARTGSNGAVDRNIVVTGAEGEVINHILLESEAISGVVIEGETDPKNVYPVLEGAVKTGTYEVTYPVGSVNIYGFEFVPGQGGDQPKGEEGKLRFTAGTVPAEVTFGSVTLVTNNGDGKMAADANTAYFGTADSQEKFDVRLKSGAKSSASNGMTFTVAEGAAGTLKIYARTGSNGATDRNIVLTDAGGKEVFNHIMLESEAISGVVIEGEADPKSVYPVFEVPVTEGVYTMTYPVGSINFYGFDFVPGTAPGPGPGPDPDPEPVSKSWVFASEAWQTELAKMGEAGKDITGTWDITIDGLNYSASKSRWTNKSIQVTQDGRADGNGVFTFTAPAAGTVTVSASGTGSTPSGDRNVVITTDGASEQVSANCNVSSGGDPATATFTVSAGEQKLYVTGALRIYSISYESAK